MTREAADPAIGWIEAAALGKPIRLEANGCHPVGVDRLNVCRGPVAGAAKFHQVSRFQSGRIENMGRSRLSGFHRGQVLGSRTVAAFAGDSRDRLVKLQTSFTHCSGGVASEARPKFLRL